MGDTLVAVVLLLLFIVVPVVMISRVLHLILMRHLRRKEVVREVEARGWTPVSGDSEEFRQLRLLLEPTLFGTRRGTHHLSLAARGSTADGDGGEIPLWIAQYTWNGPRRVDSQMNRSGRYAMLVLPERCCEAERFEGPVFGLDEELLFCFEDALVLLCPGRLDSTFPARAAQRAVEIHQRYSNNDS